jgi:hypothetical protein
VGSDPRAFAEAIAEESVVWQKVIRERGLTAQ